MPFPVAVAATITEVVGPLEGPGRPCRIELNVPGRGSVPGVAHGEEFPIPLFLDEQFREDPVLCVWSGVGESEHLVVLGLNSQPANVNAPLLSRCLNNTVAEFVPAIRKLGGACPIGEQISPEDDQHRLCFERLCEEPSSDSRSWKDQLCDEMDESRLEELERERNNPRLQED